MVSSSKSMRERRTRLYVRRRDSAFPECTQSSECENSPPLEAWISYLDGKGGWRVSRFSLASSWLRCLTHIFHGLGLGCPASWSQVWLAARHYVWLCVLTGIFKDRPAQLKTSPVLSAFVHCVSFRHYHHTTAPPTPQAQNLIGAMWVFMHFHTTTRLCHTL